MEHQQQQQLGGLHHVSAITGDAAGNVAFFTQVLGLRLVKKTVNQDDVSAYHLFYGDEFGRPGTEVTFFDFQNAITNRNGSGEIEALALSVPNRAALDWWEHRFDQFGVSHGAIEERAGRATLPFTDPEGQRFELVAVDDTDPDSLPGRVWEASPIPPEYQIRGLHAVRIAVRQLEPTERVLTDVMGFRRGGSYPLPHRFATDEPVHIFEVGPGGSGAEVHVAVRPDQPRARGGAGGVHHVAFRTPNDEEHLNWQRHISNAGLNVTPQIDRFYFRSIYFREPGGVLYEIATDGPGFATDEDPAHLGEQLSLPPFLEPHRAQIEAGLRPIDVPQLIEAGR
ncbi:MAG TPA: ring-cleaving dioxygenase [Thermomicrobiales bacterium]|nr:ring-cleaving dioxygenase [Thermomicrobiales bacterium]